MLFDPGGDFQDKLKTAKVNFDLDAKVLKTTIHYSE